MSSLEDLSVVRTAIDLCNNSELKMEILGAPGSGYDEYKKSDKFDLKIQWNKILEKKTAIILENLGLIKQLWGKVTGLVIIIGIRMVIWAEYHEIILGLTREFSIKFLNSSLFTPQGIIDNKKAAEDLMKDNSLSITQKCKLACLYCLNEHISDLYKEMSGKDKKKFFSDQCSIRLVQTDIVKFWSYYLMGQIDELRGEKSQDQYMLEKSIESGSKSAVEYCLEKTSLSRKKDAVIDAALKTVRTKTNRLRDDSVVFKSYGYGADFYLNMPWTPNDYFGDILFFLLSKMREDQKIEFLKKDIEDGYYDGYHENWKHSRALEHLLDWPYQNYFMNNAKLMWEFLPENSYADLLLKICDKINPSKGDIKYGEEKTYDYRKLFREFWCQSPSHYKRYVFSLKEITFYNEKKTLNVSRKLIVKLFTLKDFTYEDSKNIETIISSATDAEKESIISLEKGKDICIGLMKEEKWEILDRFVSNCFPSKEKAEDFKRKLSFTKEAQRVCIIFVEKKKVQAAESLMRWSSLTEQEILQLKKKIISSCHARKVCLDLFLDKGVENADKFCEWCFSSEEEIRKFKKELIFSDGVDGCADLIIEDKYDVVDGLINWSLFSPEEIREFKKHLQHQKGNDICEELISGIARDPIWGCYMSHRMMKFKGGKWDQVEKFLSWCFSAEEEISHFKKRLLKESGKQINYNFIESNQWEEAETFFSWLRLSPEEVKQLKKETLWDFNVFSLFSKQSMPEWLFSIKGVIRLSEYGSKQEAIEQFSRWLLTDRGTVLEVRDHFKLKYDTRNKTEEDSAALKNFYSAIEQRLCDLDQEQRGVKRKWKPIFGNLCQVGTKLGKGRGRM